MKKSELRIGSIVEAVHVKAFKGYSVVKGIKPKKVKLNGTTWLDYSAIKPIPLTEEWLFKFGFIKKHDENGYCLSLIFKTKSDSINNIIEHKIKGLYLNKSFCGIRFLNIEYKHVHQLQNLYYALTQTELQIK